MDNFSLRPSPAVHDDKGKAWWPTPLWAPRLLWEACPALHRCAWIVEPSAGEGPICEVAAMYGHNVVAVEVREECWHPLSHVLCQSKLHKIIIGDWLKQDTGSLVSPMVGWGIVGNPPHDPPEVMLEHVLHCVESKADVVALLLPTTFLHSVGRHQFHVEHPLTALYPLARRPSCTLDASGSGKRDLSWFVWEQLADGQQLQVLA